MKTETFEESFKNEVFSFTAFQPQSWQVNVKIFEALRD